jgi:hypothetical protein
LKVRFTVQGVVGEVADEKKRRKNKRGEHRGAVRGNPFGADEKKAGDEGRGRKAVKHRIEGGKKKEVAACFVRWRMVIDQPEDKEAGDGAEADDGGDDAGRGAVSLVVRVVTVAPPSPEF